VKKILLTQGKFALVDDADFEAVNQFKWHATKFRRAFYACRSSQRVNGKQSTIYLHRFLMPGIDEIDHKDGNGLNNQRNNLRAASRAENLQAFRRKWKKTTSKFRGVYWDKHHKLWCAQLRKAGIHFNLGRFVSETDAALAYDAAARKYFGEFASPNFNNKQNKIKTKHENILL